MRISLIILIVLLTRSVQSATKYDFNACRIQNCVEKEKTCIEDQATCLKGFSETRKCLNTCLGQDQLEDYKQCWNACKNSISSSNTQYQAVARCYQQICYMSGKNLKLIAVALILLLSVIIL